MSRPTNSSVLSTDSAKSLCAIFDFSTFVLNSEWMNSAEINKRSLQFPLKAISGVAVQEYVNNSKTVVLLVLNPEDITKLKKIKLPILGKKKSIYITITTEKEERDCKYIQLSSKKHKFMKPIKCDPNGMVFAIVFEAIYDERYQKEVYKVNDLLYHGHSSNVYVPTFDERPNKKEVFLKHSDNSIVSIKSYFKSKMKDKRLKKIIKEDIMNKNQRKRKKKKKIKEKRKKKKVQTKKKLNLRVCGDDINDFNQNDNDNNIEFGFGLHSRSISMSSTCSSSSSSSSSSRCSISSLSSINSSSLSISASLSPLNEETNENEFKFKQRS